MEPQNKEPTPTEVSSLRSLAKYYLAAIIVICVSVCFIYSVEYRPIATTYRTVAFNTAYQPSTSRTTLVMVPPQIVSSLSLTAGQTGTINFQVSDNTGANFVTIAPLVNGNTGTLVVGLNTNNTQGVPVTFVVPPSCSYQMVTSGGSTFTIPLKAQETNL